MNGRFLIIAALLLLTLCASFISSSISFATLSCNLQLQQFYECKHLVMKPLNASSHERLGGKKFAPDASIPGNRLNDSFLSDLLGKKSLSEALDLFFEIYTSLRNCSSNFCKCADVRISSISGGGGSSSEDSPPPIDSDYNSFGSRERFEQVKRIIVEFDEKHGLVGSSFIPFGPLPSLSRFCQKFERLLQKGVVLHDYMSNCSRFDRDDSLVLRQCYMQTGNGLNWLKVSSTEMSADEIENVTVCFIKSSNVLTCSPQAQRFYVVYLLLGLMNKLWPRIKSSGGSNTLHSYADKLIQRAANYTFPFMLQTASLTIWNFQENYLSLKLPNIDDNDDPISCDIDLNDPRELLISAQFNISGNRVRNHLKEVEYQSIRVSSSYDVDNGRDEFVFSQVFNFQNSSSLVTDCSIRDPLNPLNKTWIRIFTSSLNRAHMQKDFTVLDIKWNVLLWLNKRKITIFAPGSLFKQASGLLVDGCPKL